MSQTGSLHDGTVENNDGDEIAISGDHRTESFMEKVRTVARKFAGREGYIDYTEGEQGNKYLPTHIDVVLHDTTATEAELVDHDDPVIDCQNVSFDAGSTNEPVMIPEHSNGPTLKRDVYIRYHME